MSPLRRVPGRPLRGVEEIVAVNSLLRGSGDAKNAIDIYVSGSVLAPMPTVPAVLLSYQVPSGHQFALTGVMWAFEPPGGWLPGDGNIVWTLDVNNPLTTSALAIAGRYVQGFGAELMPIGSYEKPWLFFKPRIFAPSDLIQLKVLTTVAIAQNSGVFNSRFIGYLWPSGEVAT
jgi:hypothetical protein